MEHITCRMLKLLIVLFIIFGLMPNLKAQKTNNFISVSNTRFFSLNDSITQKIEKLRKRLVYKKISIVKIGKITDHLINNILLFNIPDQKEKFKAYVTEFKYISENDFVWKGDIIDKYGSITIICENGKVFGHIMIEDQHYEIQDIEGNTLLLEFDNEYVTKKCKGIEIKRKEEILNKPLINTSTEALTCTGLVRILVLYTPAAQNSVPNIFNTATLAINQLNEALTHSGISKSQLTTVLAATKFIDFKETTNAADDCDKISKNPVAMQLRSQYQADLVVILTGSNYPWITGCSLVGPPVWSHDAYNIVEAESATPSFTFAHEVAHLFGCRHEASDDPNGVYEHGYQFTSGWWLWKKYWRTIMHVDLGDGDWVRVNHFSNPNVEHYNNATGVANKNDNARKLRESSCIIENLYPYSGRPYVAISGPTEVSDGGSYAWCANVQGGSPPYSYYWEISNNGTTYNYFGSGQYVSACYPFDNYPILETTSDFQVNSTLDIPQVESIYHLRVKVTDSKQETAYDFITIYNYKSLPSVDLIANSKNTIPFSVEKKYNYNNEELGFSIYPNPAQVFTNLQYQIENPCEVQITILNSVGQTLQSYEMGHTTSGVFCKKLNIDQLENGIYFINVILGDKFHTHKLIISR